MASVLHFKQGGRRFAGVGPSVLPVRLCAPHRGNDFISRQLRNDGRSPQVNITSGLGERFSLSF